LSRDGKASKLLRDGVSGFIQKPYRFEEISKAIDDVLVNT